MPFVSLSPAAGAQRSAGFANVAGLLFVSLLFFMPCSRASAAASAPPDAQTTAPAGSKLEAVIIISRHGVRSPLKDVAQLDKETSNSWSTWDVPPGHITPRGRELMVELGGYYRKRFIKDGLLTGNDAADASRTYVHANVVQRTVQSGAALAEGLFPSTTTTIHRLDESQKDRLFYGSDIEDDYKAASINGRLGNDLKPLLDSLQPEFSILEKSLDQKNLSTSTLSSLALAAGVIDSYILEYCEGFPLEKVAFGRITPQELFQMFRIVETQIDLIVRTPYLAQRRMSNLVSHIGSTFQRIATGKPVDGAFGDADDRLFIIAGHDTTVCSVAALLRLEWSVPQTGRNLCPPGGALVFELRSRAAEAGPQHFVQAYFVTQTLNQMREHVKVSLENPPAVAPIFIPEASAAAPGYESPLAAFQAVIQKLINPALVVPVDDGPAR